MSTVRIPPVLRSQTGGERDVEAEGSTVRGVLDALTEKYPGLREQLFDGAELQRFVNVYLNDEDIQYLNKLETAVQPQDNVIILPAMAGG